MLLLVALVFCCMTASAEVVSEKTISAARSKGSVRVLVALRPATLPLLAAATGMPNRGIKREAAVAARIDKVLARLPRAGYRVKTRFALVPAVSMIATAATLERLRRDPEVLRIDIDAPGRAHASPDEASNLNNVAPLANVGYDGSGTKVVVIDSGIDTDHPDLAARLVDQQCFCSVTSGSGGCCPNGQATQGGAGAAEDGNGHGTNVAGIMVGSGGIAPRGVLPAAQLVAIRVLANDGSFCCSSDIVKALDWVAAHHPDAAVVNMSLGTNAVFAGDCDGQTSYTLAFANAITNLRNLGITVVASSGNAGNSNASSAPACVRDAVGVGATWDFYGGSRTFLGCTESSTMPRQPTCFTNRSTTTDLYAAGAFVTRPA